jgi:hypothetical protein
MEDPKTGPKIQLQVDDDIAQGTYANLVIINHTESEFLLDFAFLQPGNGRAKVRSRIISSPRHTKRLLRALQKNLERYEEGFGRIDVPDDDPEPIVVCCLVGGPPRLAAGLSTKKNCPAGGLIQLVAGQCALMLRRYRSPSRWEGETKRDGLGREALSVNHRGKLQPTESRVRFDCQGRRCRRRAFS